MGRGSSILTHQATQAPESLQTSLGRGLSILTHQATQAPESLETSLGRGSSILTHQATPVPFLRPLIRQKSQRYRKPLSNFHHRICFLEYGMYLSFICNVLSLFSLKIQEIFSPPYFESHSRKQVNTYFSKFSKLPRSCASNYVEMDCLKKFRKILNILFLISASD